MARKAAKKKTKKGRTPAKKVSKKAGAGETPALELPGSPCASRGRELPGSVRVRTSDRVEAFFQVCASEADLLVSVHHDSPTSSGGTFLFDGRIPPPNPVVLPLALHPGRYVLQWGYLVAGPWEVAAEVWVNGAPMFRKVNTHEDGIPYNTIFAVVEVLP